MTYLTWLGNQPVLSIAFALVALVGVGIGAWLSESGMTDRDDRNVKFWRTAGDAARRAGIAEALREQHLADAGRPAPEEGER